MIGEQAALKPNVYQLGNGECVVLVQHSTGMIYLWNVADWEAHKQKWAKLLFKLEEV
jgi:hypothetical protein